MNKIEMSHEVTDNTSFFITERQAQPQNMSNIRGLNKSLNINRQQLDNRSTSVQAPKDFKKRLSKSKQLSRHNDYHYKSEYGMKDLVKKSLIKK